MKVSVDRTLCRRYTVCVDLAPEVFDVDETGMAVVTTDEVEPELQDLVRRVARACPEGAIVVVDE